MWNLLYARRIQNTPHYCGAYGVATVSRIDKSLGIFCRISSLLQGFFAKETYNFIDPTNRSHPISRLIFLHIAFARVASFSLFLSLSLSPSLPPSLFWSFSGSLAKVLSYGLFKTPDQPRAKVLSYFGNVPNTALILWAQRRCTVCGAN